jgi:hypothetical protein
MAINARRSRQAVELLATVYATAVTATERLSQVMASNC